MILFCERQMGRCWHLNKPEGSSAAQRQSMCPGFNRQHCKHKQTSKLEKQNLSHSTSEENTGFTSWRGKRMLNGFHSFLDKTNLKAIWHKTSYGHYLAYEVMALLRKKKKQLPASCLNGKIQSTITHNKNASFDCFPSPSHWQRSMQFDVGFPFSQMSNQ